MALVSRLFSLGPRVQKRAGRLIAASGWRSQALTLWSTYRQVVVDPNVQAVIIRGRIFWLIPRIRRIPFQAIRAVLYSYSDVNPTSSFAWAYNTVDLFTVGLRLLDGSEVTLFRFFGEGEFVNEGIFPDWFYWEDYLLDQVGTQENESRVFAELVSKMTGAPIDSIS